MVKSLKQQSIFDHDVATATVEKKHLMQSLSIPNITIIRTDVALAVGL
jgi:hypothetical protein